LTANDLKNSTAEDLRQRLFAPASHRAGDFGRRREGPVVLPPAPSWSERIGLTAFFSARNEAQNIFTATGAKPKLLSLGNFSALRGDLIHAVRLMGQEKEILLFAALQWLVIGIAYFLWIQVIDWIPDSVWVEVARALEEDREAQTGVASLALWGWSLLIIATAAYPIALLNAAIAATHYLRASNQRSTLGACLQLAFRNMGRLWLFTAMDAFVTVNAIADRLPRKRGRRTAAEEAAYYAWKVATAGVLPSLVAGNGFVMAAKESIRLLEDQPVRTIGIRMAYSLLCWIVGVLAYLGAIVFFMMFGGPLGGENGLYHFYMLMGAPIFFAVGVTSLLRPLFVIAVSKLYTDVIPVDVETGPSIAEAETVIDIPAIAFVMLLGFLLTLYFSA
jgi:hypothetical protein